MLQLDYGIIFENTPSLFNTFNYILFNLFYSEKALINESYFPDCCEGPAQVLLLQEKKVTYIIFLLYFTLPEIKVKFS